MSATTIVNETDAARREPKTSAMDPVSVRPADPPTWMAAQRVLFRFVFAYLILYSFPFPIFLLPTSVLSLPGVMLPSAAYASFWGDVVPRIGRQLFGMEIMLHPSGSGDMAYNYVQDFCFAIAAAVVAAAWSLLDRKRTAYPTLHRWLRVYVRFYLASMMINYGSLKVIKSQFPDPPIDRLMQPFGDASPMGLLWTFIGVSPSYNVFTGAGEMIGGLLLTARRTTLLGALVCFSVMSHVAMLNFSYDVPVKLLSMHLLAMSLFLMAPDLGRLARMFVLNRAVEPAPIRPMTPWTWVDRGATVLRTLVVAYFTANALSGAQAMRQGYLDLCSKVPLRGVWDVEAFEVERQAAPTQVAGAERWRRVIFDAPGLLAVQLMSDSRQRFGLTVDTAAKTMAVVKRDNPTDKTVFSYNEPETGLLVMEGTLDGRKIKARMRRTEPPEFLLLNRGFHWISEYPFNR